MANRTFKEFTIQAGGTPQPLVGTWITSTVAPGGQDPQGETVTTLAVADSSMFKQGDYALIQTVTYTVPERLLVVSVPTGTSVKVHGLQNVRTGGAFGTGDFVSFANPVNRPYIQCIAGNAGSIYVGTTGLVKATLANVIAVLTTVASGTQPVEYTDSRYYTADPVMASDLWIDGTTADGYLPSFGVS